MFREGSSACRLRSISSQDLPYWQSILSDTVAEGLFAQAATHPGKAELQQLFELALNSALAKVYAILPESTKTLAGFAGAFYDRANNHAELFAATHPDFRCMGLASQALKQTTEVIEALGLCPIAYVDSRNIAGYSLLAKIGFVSVGVCWQESTQIGIFRRRVETNVKESAWQ